MRKARRNRCSMMHSVDYRAPRESPDRARQLCQRAHRNLALRRCAVNRDHDQGRGLVDRTEQRTGQHPACVRWLWSQCQRDHEPRRQAEAIEARDSHFPPSKPGTAIFRPKPEPKPGTAIFCQLGQPYRRLDGRDFVLQRIKLTRSQRAQAPAAPKITGALASPGSGQRSACGRRRCPSSSVGRRLGHGPKPGSEASEARDSHFLPSTSAV